MSSPSNTIPEQPEAAETQAFLALGSNLASAHGTPAVTVQAAMERIAGWSKRPLLRSSLWLSEPIDCPPGSPGFINAVVAMVPDSALSAHELLARMLQLEQEFGRQRGGVVNAPRCLDLDLICFGELQVADDDLILPHPGAHERGFVLLPLAEIAPDLRLPGHSQRVFELASRLDGNGPGIERID